MSESMPQRRNATGVPVRIECAPGVDEDPAVQAAHLSEAKVVSDEAIARRAYDKFVGRGCAHGGDREDWAQAKSELLAEARKD